MSELEAQLSTVDLATSEDYMKNMDELVNCKIVMGMKKAVQMIFDKFDILCQQKVKAMVKSEVDARIKELKELAREMQLTETGSTAQKTRSKMPVQSPPTKKTTPKRQKKCSANKKQLNSTVGAIPPDPEGTRGGPTEPGSARTLEVSKSKGSVRNRQSEYKADMVTAGNEKAPSDFKIDLVGDEVVLMPTERMFEKFANESYRAKDPQSDSIAKKSGTKVKKGHKRSMSNESVNKLSKKSPSVSQPVNEKSWRVPLPFKRTTSPPKHTLAPTQKKEPEIQPQQKTNTNDLPKPPHQKSVKKDEVVTDSPPETKQQKEPSIQLEKQLMPLGETPIGRSVENKDKAMSSKLKFSHHQKQVSAQFDQLDEIHLEKDPIEVSLQQRMTNGGCIRSVVRSGRRAQNMSHFFFTLRLKAPDTEMNCMQQSRVPAEQPSGESPVKLLGESQMPSSNENRTPMMSEGRTYTHFLNSNFDTIPEDEIDAVAQVVAQNFGVESKARSRHKRNQSLHHVLQVKNVLNQSDQQDKEQIADQMIDHDGSGANGGDGGQQSANSEGHGVDQAINIIIEPQEQENDDQHLKLSEEFDNERIQNTINNIAMNQDEDQLKCSIIDNQIESGEDELQNEEVALPHPGNSMFNQMFETSPGLAPEVKPAGLRSHYNETILENSQEQDSPVSAGNAVEPISDPAEAMGLLQKNRRLLQAEARGLNLVNLAGDLRLVTFKKGEMIVDQGEINDNFYILKKGTLKITDYEAEQNPFDQQIDQKITQVRYVSEEGQSFFGDIYDIRSALQQSSLEAMDERCELYVLDSAKRAKLKDNDMAKMIHSALYMTQAEKEASRAIFPSRQTFILQDGIQVTSEFDSGNMQMCLINSNQAIQGQYAFDIWVQTDSHPYIPAVNDGRVAFFFAVTGIPPDSQESHKRRLRFNLKNLSNPRKMMAEGYSPVYLEATNQVFQDLASGKLPFHRQKWKRVPGGVTFPEDESSSEASFQYLVNQNFKSSDYVLFAYAHPYTFNDMLNAVQEVEQKCLENENVYYECNEIAQSFEARPLHLLTLSTKKAIEAHKPIIFLVGRTHAGATPASHMLQGILDKLTDFNDPQTGKLLENYVFMILPMLNPDGVARGYWMRDTLGLNLDSHYEEPWADVHPTVWAAKEAVLECHRQGRLNMFFDFQASVEEKGSLIQGNFIMDTTLQTEAMMLPRLMALNCVNFDFKECSFLDPRSESIEASARSVIFKQAMSNPFTYTVKAHFHVGQVINPLIPRYDTVNDVRLTKELSTVSDASSTIYKGLKPPSYGPEVFKDIGSSILISLLDYDMINPVTRLISRKGQSVETALSKIRKDLLKKDEIITTMKKRERTRTKTSSMMSKNKRPPSGKDYLGTQPHTHRQLTARSNTKLTQPFK